MARIVALAIGGAPPFAMTACASPLLPATIAQAPFAGRTDLPDEAAIAEIVRRHDIVTAGFGVIQDGELVWERYLGEQSPGVAAGPGTQFNVASVTKTVTAETILRLADQGRLLLDEPMVAHWLDPDIASDPRRLALTPRTALSHSTGFPNWRFFLPGGRLAFQSAPGERYSYSGEGMEYLARFTERKLGRPFPDLVQEVVLGPVGMTHTSLVARRGEAATSIARPVDEAGEFPGYYCRPAEQDGGCRADGSYSAADDMVTTVRDYALFLKAVATAEGYSAEMAADRDRIHTDKGDQAVVDCASPSSTPCPDHQGYGLGFNVLRLGDAVVLQHGGADWSEVSLAYIGTPSQSGVIIFLNAPNARALAAMPELIEQIDPGSPFTGEYRRWLANARQP
ncbi:MAG: serine hydrolase domain-containing protein [Phenylobacterium sp.]|uniref:serine hydrolase domain-containing protein n=1 Tax=Phenylobacterium sp. TaxID=1871053 RepID=UPI0027156282|nr:serine hydrolase domain-containing protein [Phenylobacterium sp.]MDO8410642.1 serine hydrolase domain-containing protein [Phenylobacterium sp.]